MAMNTEPRFPDLVKWAGVTIVNADGTAFKTLWTAPVNGSKITSISATSDDTATKDMQLWMSKGGVDFLLGTKTIAITAGFVTGTPAFNWFDGVQIPGLPVDADGQRYLFLENGCVLKAKLTVAATAAKTHYLTAYGCDF
jgi:hypothetical protein